MDANEIRSLGYVDFMALLNEINRPPGGKDSLRVLVQNTFLTRDSQVLDVGCNTGYCTFEIAELIKCRVIGVDLNRSMIAASRMYLRKLYPHLLDRVSFSLGDGTSLDFPDNHFDLVMSGGSTAFIHDIPQAISEYARVTKPWGFVGDINFYYRTAPPTILVKKLNDLMGTYIESWDKSYWHSQYRKTGLELYSEHHAAMKPVSKAKIQVYCQALAEQKEWDLSVRNEITQRLFEIMELFNENHRYLAYGVFVLRKRSFPELTLFTGTRPL